MEFCEGRRAEGARSHKTPLCNPHLGLPNGSWDDFPLWLQLLLNIQRSAIPERGAEAIDGQEQSQIQESLSFLTRPQLGPFFVLKFARSWVLGRDSSTVFKLLSDRKVQHTQKMAVNGH